MSCISAGKSCCWFAVIKNSLRRQRQLIQAVQLFAERLIIHNTIIIKSPAAYKNSGAFYIYASMASHKLNWLSSQLYTARAPM